MFGIKALDKLYWYIWNMPYYEIFVMEDNQILKSFVQSITTSNKNHMEDISLVDKKLKRAWWINDDYIINKRKFIYHVDINNAMPLKFIPKEYNDSDSIIVKSVKKNILMFDLSEEALKKINTAYPKKVVGISYPPTLFYQELEALFVNRTLDVEGSKFDLKTALIILACGAGAVLLFMVMTGGFKLW